MAIEKILYSAKGLFSSAYETWHEASVVTRTAVVAGSVFTIAGTVYLLRPRPLPAEKVKVKPEVSKQKEEAEDEQGKHIVIQSADINWKALKADGILKGDELPEEEEEVCVSKASPSVLQDLFVRKEAFSELIEELKKRVTILLELVGGETGNKPEPILEALDRLKKVGEPLVMDMIKEEVSFDLSLWIGWIEYFRKLIETDTKNPDVKLDPKWAKKLDQFLIKHLQTGPYDKLKYAWSGIIGAWWKGSVFSGRIPAIRFLVTSFVSIDDLAKNYLTRMEVKRLAIGEYNANGLQQLPKGWHESWWKHLEIWRARWKDDRVLKRDEKLAMVVLRNQEAVKEAYGALYDLALGLYDAITNTLRDKSEHEVFNLFWDQRAKLYEEAGEGRADLLKKTVDEALTKVRLSSLKEALQ